jgi:hypothetical protein
MDDRKAPAERLIGAPLDERDLGKPLSERARLASRSVEDYLRAGGKPRWMERLMEIDRATKRHRRRLERTYNALQDEVAEPEFESRWRATAAGWDFSEVNLLITQHNDWYPIERDLPMDLRTRDYVRVGGRSYRRTPLDAAWILEQFPARLEG